MKLVDAIKIYSAVKGIVEDDFNVDVTLKYKLLGVVRAISPAIEDFENLRNEYFIQNGEQLEDGSIVIKKPKEEDFDNEDSYNDALKEYDRKIEYIKKQTDKLLNSDVSINIPKLNKDEVFNCGISVERLSELYEIIE